MSANALYLRYFNQQIECQTGIQKNELNYVGIPADQTLYRHQYTREQTINIFLQMRLLIALMLFTYLLGICTSSEHRFIVFIHDGTFYKLDPETKEVQWHNQLPFKLLSLDITPEQDPENHTKKIFIPTVDGDFLYLEHSLYHKHSKQLLVPREDVEHLLDICFDSKPEQKYFVYQKLEYFVLNTDNGQYAHLQDYLNQKRIFNKSLHSIIIVAKKLLKQLNAKMEVKWSVISSKVTLVDVNQFVQNSKLNQLHVQHDKYSFTRIDPKTIQILDENKNVIFQIQGSSSIMNIFLQDRSKHTFSKMMIKNYEHKMLALGESSHSKHQNKQIFNQIAKAMGQASTSTIENFPQSIQFPKNDKQGFQNVYFDHLEICMKTQKILKEAAQSTQGKIISGKTNKQIEDRNQQVLYHYTEEFNPEDLPTIPFSSDKHIRVIITKEQPFVYVFLIVIIVGGGIMFYRFKVNKLWEQISHMENMTDENIKKITAKLGQYENVGRELKKMYEVNWNNLLYRNQSYFVFEGRFLNQNVEVFMLPLKGFDIVDIQHKLNILINFSHKHMSKLYYYTINDDSLLIFNESAQGYKKLTDLDMAMYERLAKQEQEYKNCIKILIDNINQLTNSKIQVNLFSQESVVISQKLELKINIIPSILQKSDQEEDKKLKDMGTTKLRLDLIKIIHKMGHKGEEFDLLKFQKEKNSEEEQNSFLKDFYDHFLLSEQKLPEEVKNAQKHPFLWDSKQKMLFVCDFSNYVQTCIDDQRISKMEMHCKNFQIVPLPWNSILHSTLAKELNSYRKYDFYSTRDLIRLIRNKVSHFHEIPKETRVYVGKTPEQFVQYFLEKYPKLLAFMYAYASRKKWKLSAAQ